MNHSRTSTTNGRSIWIFQDNSSTHQRIGPSWLPNRHWDVADAQVNSIVQFLQFDIGFTSGLFQNIFKTMTSARHERKEEPRNDSWRAASLVTRTASSSVASEWVKGKTLNDAVLMTNRDIAFEQTWPPVKLQCWRKMLSKLQWPISRSNAKKMTNTPFANRPSRTTLFT